MNRFVIHRAILALFVAIVAIGSTLYTKDTLAKPVVSFRVYSTHATTNMDSTHVWYARFEENIAKTFGDKVKLNYFPNGILGKESDAIQQVRNGAIDIALTGSSIWSTIIPEMGVLDLGYLFDNSDQVGVFLDGKPGEYLNNQLLKKGNNIVLGWGYSFGARNIYTIKPVTQYSDLNGMKIRVLPVNSFIEIIKNMGAVPIPMPYGEVYSGLQMGVIDGVEHDNPTILANKYYEIVKYALETKHVYNPMLFSMNVNSFNRIPDDMKKGFMDAARDATLYQRAQAKIMDADAKNQLEKLGIKYTALDNAYFSKAVQPLWGKFFTQYPDTSFMLPFIPKRVE